MAYNVYILCESRTGSSYLCGLLNLTNSLPTIVTEYGYTPLQSNDYKNLPLNSKLVGPYYFKQRNFTLSDIQAYFPDMRYIHLQRRDKIATAVSLFLSTYRKKKMFDYLPRNSKVYKKIFGDNYEKIYKLKNIFKLNYVYKRVVEIHERYPKEINKEGVEVLPVYYEDILQDKEREFYRVCNYLNIDDKARDIALRGEAKKGKLTLRIQREQDQQLYSMLTELLLKCIG